MSAQCIASVEATSTKSRLSSLSRSSAKALSIRILGAGGLFLSHVILVRGLGMTGFGEYAEAIAWLQVLCVLAKFGFDNASLRYVSEYRTRGEVDRLQGFRQYSRRITFATCIGAMLLIVGALLTVRGSIEPRLAGSLIIAALMIPLIAQRQIQESSLRGLGLLFESQISNVVWPLTLFVLAGLVMAISPTSLTSPVAMTLHLTAMIVVSLMVYRFLLGTNLLESSSQSDESCSRQWIHTAAIFVAAELLIGLKSRICIVMAARLLGSDSAGLYAAMDRFAEVSVLGSQSLGFVIAPQFASLFAAGRYSEMRKLMRQGSILAVASTLPVAVGILCSSDVIFMLLGPGYRQGWYLLLTLLISICISVLSGPSAYVLQMTGRERTVLLITGLCAATNIVCGLLLIGPLGLEGLGVSQIITSVVWTVGVRLSLLRHPAWKDSRPNAASIALQNIEIGAAQ